MAMMRGHRASAVIVAAGVAWHPRRALGSNTPVNRAECIAQHGPTRTAFRHCHPMAIPRAREAHSAKASLSGRPDATAHDVVIVPRRGSALGTVPPRE